MDKMIFRLQLRQTLTYKGSSQHRRKVILNNYLKGDPRLLSRDVRPYADLEVWKKLAMEFSVNTLLSFIRKNILPVL